MAPMGPPFPPPPPPLSGLTISNDVTLVHGEGVHKYQDRVQPLVDKVRVIVTKSLAWRLAHCETRRTKVMK